MNIVRYLLGVVLGIGLTYAVQRWDRSRLDSAQRESAWNAASWGAALYAFGPLSMIGWVWVTRQRFRAWWRASPAIALGWSFLLVVAGVATSALILLAIVGVDRAVAWLSGAPE